MSEVDYENEENLLCASTAFLSCRSLRADLDAVLQRRKVAAWYKLSLTGILALVFVFLIAKKLWLDGLLEKCRQKISNIEVQLLAAEGENAIQALKKAYRNLQLIDLFARSVVPVLAFVAALFVISAVQEGAVKLFGAMALSGVSMVLGVVCKIIEIYTAKAEHEGKQ